MTYTTIKGKSYTIETEGNFLLVIDNDATYKIKVFDNWEYALKINKKSLSSKHGAKGLYEFFEDNERRDVLKIYTDNAINFTLEHGIRI